MTIKDVLDIEEFGEKNFRDMKYTERLSECENIYDAVKETAKMLTKDQASLVESCANKLRFIEDKQDYKTAALKIAETRELMEDVESDDENFTHALALLKIKSDEICEEYGLSEIDASDEVLDDISFVSGIVK